MQAWKSWKTLRYVVLCVALAGLGWSITSQTRGLLFRGSPRPLKTPYTTEAEWVTTQIVRDLTDLLALALDGKSADVDLRPSSNLLLWDPDAFAPAVRRNLDTGGVRASDASGPEAHAELTSLTAATLVTAAARVSARLTDDVRDAHAHDAAAVIVGAFALRDSAADFADIRWSLNRMTVHLAMAQALRPEAAGSADRVLARAMLLALTNHQRDALALLDGIKPMGDSPASSWARALRMRITQDWRLVSNPSSSTRLEKLEYFRARRIAVSRVRATADLAAVGEPAEADFVRIIQANPWGVQDGGEFVAAALDVELADAADVYQAVTGQPMPGELHIALNVEAGALHFDGRVDILPWGAWAQFFQRHIAMHVGQVDSFHRHSRGARQDADQVKSELDRQLGRLTLFPLGACRRTKGPNGLEADLTQLTDAIDVATRAPQLITYANWTWFENGQRYEPSVRPMPGAATWFAASSKERPFEAGVRLTDVATPAFDALVQAAPYDHALIMRALGPPTNPQPRSAHAVAALASRAQFDLRAMDAAAARATTTEAQASIHKAACALTARDCIQLAWTLTRSGTSQDAVRQFEDAFADPEIDAIAVANNSSWLVSYYLEQKRLEDARALARRSAKTYAFSGLVTSAYLHERLGEYDEALDEYQSAAERYDNDAQLLGFYYRHAVVRGHAELKSAWESALRERFPNGLEPVPPSFDKAPQAGVFVYSDSPRARAAGLRAGDIIVGLEGWRVYDDRQYFAINAFFETPQMKVTIWRGQLITIEATMAGRLFGVDLKSYPLRGWIEN